MKKFTWFLVLLPSLFSLEAGAQNYFSVNASRYFTTNGTLGGGAITNPGNLTDASPTDSVTITAPNTSDQWGIGSNLFNESSLLSGIYYVGFYFSSVADTNILEADLQILSVNVPQSGNVGSIESSFANGTVAHWKTNTDGSFSGNVFFQTTPGNPFNGAEIELEGDIASSTITAYVDLGYAMSTPPTDANNPYGVVTPVTLSLFTVGLDAKQMPVLNWSTSSEQNSSYFEVERSSDGSQFSGIGQVAAHGTTSLTHNYIYTDPDALQGINYYRLRMVDLDGKFAFSKILSIDIGNHGHGMLVYPNPVYRTANLQFNVKTTGEYKVDLISMSGQVVRTEVIQVGSTQQTIPFNRDPGISSGVYILHAVNISTGESYEKKLLMQ